MNPYTEPVVGKRAGAKTGQTSHENWPWLPAPGQRGRVPQPPSTPAGQLSANGPSRPQEQTSALLGKHALTEQTSFRPDWCPAGSHMSKWRLRSVLCGPEAHGARKLESWASTPRSLTPVPWLLPVTKGKPALPSPRPII